VTLRDNIERPEALDLGSNVLAGTDPLKIIDSVRMMIDKKPDWENPFGDGTSGIRIIIYLCSSLFVTPLIYKVVSILRSAKEKEVVNEMGKYY